MSSPGVKTFSPRVHRAIRAFFTRPVRFLYGCEVIGAENLPEKGPAIFASSHSSNLDPVIVGISYPGVIRWLAKAELWKIPGFGQFLERGGAFMIKRGEADRDAIRGARELLKEGWVVGIFPEGTRFREGSLGEFQPGVGMLAVGAGVPVIPIRVRGNEKIMRGLRFRRPRVTITAGPPVDLDISGMSKGRAYHEATRRIQAAVEAL